MIGSWLFISTGTRPNSTKDSGFSLSRTRHGYSCSSASTATRRRHGTLRCVGLAYARRTAETKFDDQDVSPEDAQLMKGHTAEMRKPYNQSKKVFKTCA
jgi:hypothetical protein